MKSNKWIFVALTAAGLNVAPFLTTSVLASPEIQQQDSVSFVSGGVGVTEMEEISRMSSGYPVQLMFVTKSVPNRYLAGTLVQIKDKNGKVVLDTQARGPVLLMKIPPGKYSITADTDGIVKRNNLRVASGKTQRIVFVWKLPVDIAP